MRIATSTPSVRMQLKYRGLVSLTPTGSEPLEVRCETGTLWITVAGVPKDFVVQAGESAALPAGQLAVVQALQPAVFSLADGTLVDVA